MDNSQRHSYGWCIRGSYSLAPAVGEVGCDLCSFVGANTFPKPMSTWNGSSVMNMAGLIAATETFHQRGSTTGLSLGYRWPKLLGMCYRLTGP
jgi:hypothetical protein